MLTGPIDVTEKVLKKAGMKLDGHRPVRAQRGLRLGRAALHAGLRHRHDKINVNGGAIAMGHPLGATGAMILGTVLDELERRDLSTALVTLCIGAGMGTATIIERVEQLDAEDRHRQSAGATQRQRLSRAVPQASATAASASGARQRRRARPVRRQPDALKPGAASSLRHWHENEDEFVYMLEGEVVLCENDGETVLKAGDAAGLKAGVAERPLPDQPLRPRRRLSRSRHARANRARALSRHRPAVL